MKTVTVSAPSNIAFIKYWGAQDLSRVVPANPSISMTLSHCRSRTTVSFDPASDALDTIALYSEEDHPVPLPAAFRHGIERHLAAIRREYGVIGSFQISTQNNFPAQAGLASSASGFAALAAAVNAAANLDLDSSGLSDLARISGSGSASRSVLGGFVEWPATPGDTHATQIATCDHWTLSDVIAIVETAGKEVSSRDGHRRATTSPHFSKRQSLLPARLDTVRRSIANRDLQQLGEVLEEEAIELHLIAMSSRPAIFYWKPATLAVLERVRHLRDEGLSAWSTMDAGANVHVICPPDQEQAVAKALCEIEGVQNVLLDRVGEGPQLHSQIVGSAVSP